MSLEVESEPALLPPGRPRAEPVPAATREQPEIVFGPRAGWRSLDVRELWEFRELVFYLAWRDVKVRYKQAALGVAWAVLQPAMTMVVFTIFFGRLAGVSSGRWPYPLFAYAGLLPWTFFATAVAGAGSSVVDSERLITKVYFPRLAIPFAAAGAAAVDFVIALGVLAVLMAWYGVVPGAGLLLLPLVFGAVLLAAVGVGTLLAALNVAYRDFRYVIPFLIQMGLFATPTVYMDPGALHTVAAQAPVQNGAEVRAGAAVPATTAVARRLLDLNPMTPLVATFRAAVLGGPIAWGRFGLAAVYASGLFAAGCLYFRRVEDRFGDII